MTSYEYVTMLEDYNFKELYPVFLEEFKNYSQHTRRLVLRDEPIRLRGTKQERAFYAAMCEFLTNYYHIGQPQWLFKEEYFLDEPYYPFGEYNSLDKSPIEFRKRNIAIGVNDMIVI